ncbi:MAG: hypothetical protein LLF98_01095 [Clostridium sp.]|uniref:hypothetical protein n=1 Tax=Clostridium sp. TaxID=1506 RepID=UPI0025C0B74C|nr:hypothetical protein [Clostridium sp.]MCE5219879.1 hypothetical protein [Clostridium sp.]
MERVFEKIFQDLNGAVKKNVNTKSLVAMSKDNVTKIKDSMDFDFVFDKNGEYRYTASQYGFGKSVNIRGKITVPEDGIYSVNIRSSDGGGGQWDGVKTNQEVSCVINTSFWHETTITVYIHSNKPDCNGHVVIDYSV